MSTIAGTWLLWMKAPSAQSRADYRFEDEAGVIRGSASGGGETMALTDIAVEDGPDGQHVTWRQRITEPLRLNLEYDVTVNGNALAGESRAGQLPSTRVTGERTSA